MEDLCRIRQVNLIYACTLGTSLVILVQKYFSIFKGIYPKITSIEVINYISNSVTEEIAVTTVSYWFEGLFIQWNLFLSD